MTAIGHVRGRQPQVVMNRLNTKPMYVLDILDFRDIKGKREKDALLMYTWEGTYSRVFNAQFLAQNLK